MHPPMLHMYTHVDMHMPHIYMHAHVYTHARAHTCTHMHIHTQLLLYLTQVSFLKKVFGL